jgi:hypothetical protein
MNTCICCQARVPSGRKYCTAHFMEALAEYEAAMIVYQQNMALWNSMSAEEQASAHANAEESTVGGYAGLVGLVVGAIGWHLLSKVQNIDALVGIGILVLSVVAFTAIHPTRVIVGRLTRLFVHAALYFIGLWIVGAIISVWSPFIKENSSILTLLLGVAVLGLPAYLEISGGHHASGRPAMPIRPTP